MGLYIINWPMFLEDGKIIEKAIEQGYKVFCDFKLYDIDRTIEKALDELRKRKVDYVSIIDKDVPKIINLMKKGNVK